MLYRNAKNMEIYEKSQCESGRGARKDQKRNRMGITKHFVQGKLESSERNQRMWNQQPIPRLSKFVVGKNGKNMADERDGK
jgi:hypothetical protein